MRLIYNFIVGIWRLGPRGSQDNQKFEVWNNLVVCQIVLQRGCIEIVWVCSNIEKACPKLFRN